MLSATSYSRYYLSSNRSIKIASGKQLESGRNKKSQQQHSKRPVLPFSTESMQKNTQVIGPPKTRKSMSIAFFL